MSILVGGGTGFVGRNFARLGANKGLNVISVSRTPGPNRMTWDDLEQKGLPDDCVAVISMSGEVILQPFKKWSDAQKKIIHDSRVPKTQLLAKAVREASKPPKVFASLSGVAYYKPDDSKEYTEEDQVEPYDWLSKLCKKWESAAALPKDSPTRSVIIRSGVVLGKDGGMIQNIKLPFYLGGGGPIGSGDQWFPWIHVKDIAGILWYAVENESVSGVLNGTAPLPVRSKHFTKEFASAMWRPHLFPLPSFVIKTVFGSEAASVMLEGQYVLPKRIMEMGYNFKFPDVESACKDLVS